MQIYSAYLKEESDVPESLFQASTRQSHLKEAQNRFSELAAEAFEIAALVDPFKPDMEVGVEIPAVEAVNWSVGNVDIRPRLIDGATGEPRLLDSGLLNL